MSISNEVQRIKNNIADSYEVIDRKNGVLPSVLNSNNLPDAIESIQGGAGDGDNILVVAPVSTATNGLAIVNRYNQIGSSINPNNWAGLSTSAPIIKYAVNNIGYNWTSVGVDLDFAKLKAIGNGFINTSNAFNSRLMFPMLETVGSNFMYSCAAFNQNIEFPMLETVGGSFMYSCLAFNQNIEFPMLETVGGSFMDSCNSIANMKITFHKLIINSNANANFLRMNSIATNIITLELRAAQTITTQPSNFLGNRIALTSSAASYVDLRINKDSVGVNVSNRTWAGMYFNSITLIDENGNVV